MDKKNKAPLEPQIPEGALIQSQNKNTNSFQNLQSEIQSLITSFSVNDDTQSDIGLFKVQTANFWIEQASKRPTPKMLFSEFWHEGEICICFADTNIGKSILAVQIAESISTGTNIPGFKLDAIAQKIVYFDFELTDKQFQNRYSIDYQHPYTFHPNFLRCEINPDSDIPDELTFEDYLIKSIEQVVVEKDVKILIIDNITYLRDETEKSKNALPLMKLLKSLKNKYGLSILVLAHTPKRDACKPLTNNDLQGSKMLINFCDSSFAIGLNYNDKIVRYIKMIKVRNTERIYDENNVIDCQIIKPDNFLKFEFLNFNKESIHLKVIGDNENNELENKIRELVDAEPGLSAYAIAQRLCTDELKFNSFKVKISRLVKKMYSR